MADKQIRANACDDPPPHNVPTPLSPERLAEIRRYQGNGHNDELLAHIDAQAGELRTVDAVLARRPALDDFATRTDKIAHAIATAKTADALDAEILALRALAAGLRLCIRCIFISDPDQRLREMAETNAASLIDDPDCIAAEARIIEDRQAIHDLRRQLDAETAAHRDVQQASLSWQEIAREYKTKLDAERRHIVLVHGEVKEVLGRLLDDPPAPARDAPLVAPPGTKNHDLASPCPKCGAARYWSDYWTDELTPICVPCRRPPTLPPDAPGEILDLSPAAQVVVAQALLEPAAPSERLIAAARRYKQTPSEAPVGEGVGRELAACVIRGVLAAPTDDALIERAIESLGGVLMALHEAAVRAETLREQERGEWTEKVEASEREVARLRENLYGTTAARHRELQRERDHAVAANERERARNVTLWNERSDAIGERDAATARLEFVEHTRQTFENQLNDKLETLREVEGRFGGALTRLAAAEHEAVAVTGFGEGIDPATAIRLLRERRDACANRADDFERRLAAAERVIAQVDEDQRHAMDCERWERAEPDLPVAQVYNRNRLCTCAVVTYDALATHRAQEGKA